MAVVSHNEGASWGSAMRLNSTTSGEQFMPGVTGDSRGVHFQWYSADSSNTFITTVGRDFSGGALGPEFNVSASFRATQTNVSGVNQDSVVSCCYMGDYNQPYSDGSHTYYGWGDNRQVFPDGHLDPNAYFNRQ